MSIIDIFGAAALVTSIIGLLPQIIKSYKTKSTADISMIMIINYAVGSIAWIVYGSMTDAAYVVWSNALCLLSSLFLAFQKSYYDKKNNNPS